MDRPRPAGSRKSPPRGDPSHRNPRRARGPHEAVPERIRVVVDGIELASSTRAQRVVETAGAPVYYLPRDDVRTDLLVPTQRQTTCEWKGDARYFAVVTPGGRVIPIAAWSYEDPLPGFEAIRDHVGFYAWAVDEAWVGDERATPQPGHFYGGWVTSKVVGPFKGGPDSSGW